MPSRAKTINNSIGSRIKKLRTAKGITQKELAEILHKSESAVRMWELEKSEPDVETLKSITDYFNVDMNYISGHSTPASPKSRATRIPVYGCVAAGIPIEAIDNFDSSNPDDWEEIDEHTAKSGEYFALRIKGDSMEPKMSSGDVVIVRKQPDVENGDVAIVCINGDEATCKKLKKTPEGVMLISFNPAYEPMFYSKKQVEELPLTILGRVVELRAKF